MAAQVILLTGATGMIGFKILTLLLEAGYHVRAAVRDQAGFDRVSNLPAISRYRSQLTSTIVPDITTPGAYDAAVQGVEYVVHVASPLAGNAQGDDWNATFLQPAVQGSVGMLESAVKVPGIKRIVVTGSVLSLSSVQNLAQGDVVTESTRCAITQPPFASETAAYSASKALSFEAVQKFVKENKPSFDVIHILPTFVIGRDETVTEASRIIKGTNGLIMKPVLGIHRPYPMPGFTVHLDDVAMLHVRALDPEIQGNQDFLAASPGAGWNEWSESFEIIRRRYPKQYAKGLFKFDPASPPTTVPVQVSSAKATEAFGINFKTFEEQVVSVVDYYLELLGES